MRDTRHYFDHKTVLVMGLGRFGGGVDVAEFAVRAGAKVIVTDLASSRQLSDSVSRLTEFDDIEFHLGSHDPVDFERADIIVVNPAVPDDNEFLELARRADKIVTSQINIFFELCPAKIIGITGANGKSTTAALIAHLLKNASGKNVIATEAKQSQATQYENVWLSGNIGNQPLLTTLDRIRSDDLVVLELSSFQLEQLAQIQKAPKIALLTNLTPNHLDRHGTFANYCAAKENIFKFQKPDESDPAVSVFNAEDKVGAEWFEKYRIETGRICLKFSANDINADVRSIFPLPGRANLSNLAAAIAVAGHFGVDQTKIRNCLPEFKALLHRLELVEEVNGVCWYNDSIATTPQSAIAALEAFEQPVIIIAGGYDKDLPFDELGREIAEHAKAAVLLGQTAPKIASAVRNAQECLAPQFIVGSKSNGPRNTSIEIMDSLPDAVNLANRLAVSGDVVLLSPACASYDMFDNFQQRGRDFTELVRQLSAGL